MTVPANYGTEYRWRFGLVLYSKFVKKNHNKKKRNTWWIENIFAG